LQHFGKSFSNIASPKNFATEPNAALGHHFLKIAQAQIIAKVPAYAQKYQNSPKTIEGFLAMLLVTKTLQIHLSCFGSGKAKGQLLQKRYRL
jgi:hypothetical protein